MTIEGRLENKRETNERDPVSQDKAEGFGELSSKTKTGTEEQRRDRRRNCSENTSNNGSYVRVEVGKGSERGDKSQ